MFYFILLSIMSCWAVGETAEFIPIPPEVAPIVAESTLACISETGIDSDVFQKLLTWSIQEDTKTKKFIHCLMTKTGYGTNTGHFNETKMEQLVASHKLKDDFKKQLHECNKLSGSDNLSTGFKVIECFVKKSPILFSM